MAEIWHTFSPLILPLTLTKADTIILRLKTKESAQKRLCCRLTHITKAVTNPYSEKSRFNALSPTLEVQKAMFLRCPGSTRAHLLSSCNVL